MTDYASFLIDPCNVDIVGAQRFVEERDRSAHDTSVQWALGRLGDDGTYILIDVNVTMIGLLDPDQPPGTPYEVDGLPVGASARFAASVSIDPEGVFDLVVENGHVYLIRADRQVWSCYLCFADSGRPLDLWGAAQDDPASFEETDLPREEVHAVAAVILAEIAGWAGHVPGPRPSSSASSTDLDPDPRGVT